MPQKRNYLLWDTFQYRFVAISLLYQLIVVMVFAAALFVPLMIQLGSSSLSSAEAEEAASEFLALHSRVWPALIVILVLLAVHSVFFSHRIAGPLYRFRSVFKAIAEGDLTVSTSIRKGDYLQKEAECLHEMVVALRARIVDMEARHGEMNAVLGELKRAMETGSTKDADESMEKLREQIERLAVSVERFRTSP